MIIYRNQLEVRLEFLFRPFGENITTEIGCKYVSTQEFLSISQKNIHYWVTPNSTFVY